MRFVIFISIFLTALTGMVSYTWIRGAQSLASLTFLKTTYHVITIVLLASLLATLFLGNYFPPLLAKVVSFVGNSYLLILVYLLFGFLLIDLVLLTNRFAGFIPDIQKFRFYAGTVLMLIVAASMIYGNYQFNHPRKVELLLKSNKPTQGKTVKMVAVSDIHLGVSIDKKRLQSYVDIINSEKPDLVLIAGDLIDRSLKPLLKQKMHEELQQIKAPLGVYAIYGNHEHFGEDIKVTEEFFRNSNITVINDTALLINEEFYLVGRDDYSNAKRKAVRDILSDTDHSKPVILLDHQPQTLGEAAENNIDLQISGHTHNGQFFPINLITSAMFENGYGYLKKGNTHTYVTSGLGIWAPQYRIGTQSEWVLINFEY